MYYNISKDKKTVDMLLEKNYNLEKKKEGEKDGF